MNSKKVYGKTLILLFVIVFLTACNVSKSLTKKGDKLADAGIHAEAVQYYIQALNRDRSTVEAQIGIRKSGNEVMSDYQSKFFKEYNNYSFHSAVYTYLEMEKFESRLKRFNADVTIPSQTTADFKIAKKKYLEAQFAKANQLMANEQFESAEYIFLEIKKIEPNYKGQDLEKLMEISKLEPPYRAGNKYLDLNKNRAAYFSFEKVTEINVNYKDSKFKLEEALDLAKYPIAILKFKNYTYDRGAAEKVSANMVNTLLGNKGPFLKILDRTNMDKVLNEQYLSMNGWVEGNGAVKTGALLGAKAVLSGKLLSVNKVQKAPQVKREKAYRKRTVKVYNPETKKNDIRYEYDKVYYNNYKGYNEVVVSFQYILVSSESGEILLTGIEKGVIRSQVDYNAYTGNYKQLIPGNWNVKFQDSPSDKMYNTRRQIKAFQIGFESEQNITPVSILKEDAFRKVGNTIARIVYSFNPED